MKKTQIGLLTLVGLMTTGCGRMIPETLNSNDTVSVANNSSNEELVVESNGHQINEASNEEKTSINETNSETATSVEVDPIAKTAIAKIEKAKNILLTDQFLIMIVEETTDTVTINIRENQEDKVVNYGYFKYTKTTDVLEEMDEITGEYQVIS